MLTINIYYKGENERYEYFYPLDDKAKIYYKNLEELINNGRDY